MRERRSQQKITAWVSASLLVWMWLTTERGVKAGEKRLARATTRWLVKVALRQGRLRVR